MKDILKKMFWAALFDAVIITCIYFLWNWLMPDLIMAKNITILQALILRALIQLCTYASYERK